MLFSKSWKAKVANTFSEGGWTPIKDTIIFKFKHLKLALSPYHFLSLFYRCPSVVIFYFPIKSFHFMRIPLTGNGLRKTKKMEFWERCQSGLSYRSRKAVGRKASGVRISPSPPVWFCRRFELRRRGVRGVGIEFGQENPRFFDFDRQRFIRHLKEQLHSHTTSSPCAGTDWTNFPARSFLIYWLDHSHGQAHD